MNKIILFSTILILTNSCNNKTKIDEKATNTLTSKDSSFSKTLLQKDLSVNPVDFRTNKYAGIYIYGPIKGNWSKGKIVIYPESDTSIIFYIYLDNGFPSHHEGSLYGQTIVINGVGEFYTTFDSNENGCRWSFIFDDKKLTLKTINDEGNCGFGYGVISDGIYKRQSSKIPEYFIDMTKTKVYFKNTKPSVYYSD